LIEGDKRRDKGALSEALSLYRLGRSVAEDAADKTVTSIALDRIGVTHFRQDDYPLALKVLGEALAIRREIGEKAAISETLDNIGRVYQWQEDFAKALAQYRESMTISTEIGDRKGVARTLSYFGSLTQRARRTRRSCRCLQQGAADARGVGRQRGNRDYFEQPEFNRVSTR
jgi:tetratricopeptide (TPR) repeat protein